MSLSTSKSTLFEEASMKLFRRIVLLAAAALLAAGGPSRADEFAIKRPSGEGAELVATSCSACHSLDYLVMNSPFQTRKSWEAEVNKMSKVFGADIPPEDAKIIVDYLAAHLGS
jgi:hypothetical protein